MKKNKSGPIKVERVVCPRCKELMVKIFPYSSIRLLKEQVIPICIRCRDEVKKKENMTSTVSGTSIRTSSTVI